MTYEKMNISVSKGDIKYIMRQTVEYCKPLIAPSRLKGFMIASWARTWRLHQDRLEEAMGKLSASRSLFEGRGA